MTDRFVAHFGSDVCASRPFYNFGAGNWRHPNFQNIDLEHPRYPNNKPDIPYDAFSQAPIPVESGSAQIFYFSQVNEHLTDEINAHVLSETHRCLAPGGLVRIAYPDFDLACRACDSDDRSFFLIDWDRGPKSAEIRSDHPVEQLWLDFFATRAQTGSPSDGNPKFSADEIREMIAARGYEGCAQYVVSALDPEVQREAPGCHINYWNHDKFERFLKVAGFDVVTRSAYLQSQCPPLRDREYFDQTLPVLSGYVEAVKNA